MRPKIIFRAPALNIRIMWWLRTQTIHLHEPQKNHSLFKNLRKCIAELFALLAAVLKNIIHQIKQHQSAISFWSCNETKHRLASDPVSSWSENREGLIWNAIAHERKFKISKLDQSEHLCRKNTSSELVQPHIRHIAGILFVMNHPQGNCLHTVLRGRHILQLAFKRFLIKKRHVAAGKWWNVKHALKRKPLISLVVH